MKKLLLTFLPAIISRILRARRAKQNPAAAPTRNRNRF
ncbi:hypothetical protein ABIA70_003863 [Arthrobacter sp. 754]